jgi:hypothetical protein
MGTVDDSRVRRRRRNVNRQVDEHASYVITITGWDSWSSFRVSDGSQWQPGPYGDSKTLTLRGEVYRPEGFKYPRAEVTLSAQDRMQEETKNPLCIGVLNANDDTLRAYVSVPGETLSHLTTVAGSGRLRMVHLSGTRLRYRKGTIASIDLNTNFVPEEW